MRICRCWLLLAMICVAFAATRGSAQECGGCLDTACLSCGPYSGSKYADPYALDFGVRPSAILGTFTFELVGLERSKADSQDILFVGANPVMNVSDLNFVPELGFRGDLVLPGDCGCDLNLNLFGSGHDYASVTRGGAGLSFVWFNGGPANPATSYTVEYKSDLISFEANLRTREWLRLMPFAGFRCVQLEEEFNILQHGGSGFFSTVDNQLYGFQVGAQGLLWERNALRLEAGFKTGVYYNNLSVHATAANAELLRTSSSTAFVGEARMTLVYQFSPRMAIKAGYQGLWLSGVALAPDQSDNGSFATGLLAFDSGSVSYQGGLLGFELTW